MNNFGVYLLEVSLCLTIFYFLYWAIFRRITFFKLNRFCLLVGLALAFLIPSFSLPTFFSAKIEIPRVYSLENTITTWEADAAFSTKNQPNTNTLNFTLIIKTLYWAGAAILFLRFVFSLVKIIHLKNSSTTEWLGELKVKRTNLSQSFTGFGLVFLPHGENNSIVIEHERIHVKQLHWIDLVLVEIALILLWFNPLIYLYKAAIKLQHEFLADSSVIAGFHTESYLNYLLRQIQVENSTAPVSQFYSSTIKQRISMITKSRSSRASSSRYLLLLPVICALLFAFSGKPDETHFPVILQPETQNNIPSIFPVDVENTTISSGFGNRMHPVLGKVLFHSGVDFQLPEGKPILATADGVVGESMYDSLYGNFIVIRHSEIFTTKYAHLKNAIIKQGDIIRQGQTIGYSGSTGLSQLPHLHYEVFKNGKRVDPADYLPKQK